MNKSRGATAISALLSQMRREHGADFNEERIQSALHIAQEAYSEMQHWSGEPLIDHVAGVLRTLMPFEPDEDAILCCILHHILQSPSWTLTGLEQHFGPSVRSLVSGVHLLSHVTLRSQRSSVNDLRLMLLTVSDDVRTVLISLCDRCYLLERVHALGEEDRKRVCQDVLQLFAPVAARLGIYSLKHDLENRAFPVLYPHDSERIVEQLQQLREQHGEFLIQSAAELQAHLRKQGVKAEVSARTKQPYSTFVKMNEKSLSHIEDIYDFYALRVIVQTVEECYQALGYIHRLGRPVPHRFKDYISFPKPNGYQSLHTTLAQLPHIPDDVLIEVQVRTEDMHREAEFGIAAHWSYKEHGSAERALESVQLHQVLASQEQMEQGDETRFVDHIYVLTPRGDIVELPEGATPLDFAFQVHTELGLCFRGARVNGSMVPIDYSLENGDIIEILRHSSPRPSAQWMQLLKLSTARAKLKRYLYAQERPQLIALGRKLLNEQLRKRKLGTLDPDLQILRLCDGQALSISQREDVLVKIGQGSEKAASLMDRLDAIKSPPEREEVTADAGMAVKETERRVSLAGGLRMPTRFAKCCKPDTGKREAIVGIVNRGGIVTIHRQGCGMLRHANPERKVKAKWVSSSP